jgi:hypothetical protein
VLSCMWSSGGRRIWDLVFLPLVFVYVEQQNIDEMLHAQVSSFHPDFFAQDSRLHVLLLYNPNVRISAEFWFSCLNDF